MNATTSVPHLRGNDGRAVSGWLLCACALAAFAGCRDTRPTPEFRGKIAKSYEKSEEWWPEPVRPPAGAPNVIIFLLDDVGFAQIGSFGGLSRLGHGGEHAVSLLQTERASRRPA